MNKDKRPPIEIATETGSVVLDAATRAGGVARRLLRRTRILTSHASRHLPVVSMLEPVATDATHITLALPEIPAPDDAAARDLAGWQARAVRAEQAAAWLRVRLRAERARRAAATHLDPDALTADLTQGLARHYGAHPDAVRRIVQRTLAAHGLPISPDSGPRASGPATAAESLPWPREQQELLARQVVARTPEVADPAYVDRVVGLLARRGRLTQAELARVAGLDSPMARRRLRLAVEALAALGALTMRDGAYGLNVSYRPVAPPIAPAARRPEPTRNAHQRNRR